LNRHEQVKDLFLRCCDLDPDSRVEVLRGVCGQDDALRAEVEAMLDFDSRRPDFLAAGAPLAPPPAVDPADAPLPHAIGPFRVLRRLGAGGMGVVYEVLQDHPRRAVALKLLHPGLAGPRLLRRFEREGELLARLEHPGIARIYGAGEVATELGAQPWLAMELVRGAPLTRWARERRATTRERLELLARVCDAVQHAHERGVVHRDLKPANILVEDSGQPRILDFGIARALDSDIRFTTQHDGAAGIVGTLAYMSPEQASGDPDAVDARSDVYTLGVLLHELLAGDLPYQVSTRSLPEAVATIRDAEPRRLGLARREYRGDIENMALRALEKDRRRRYPTAAALAADLRRHLRDEPIEARPPSRTYVLRKYVRRHRVTVAAAGAVILALSAGLASSLRSAWSEARQRGLAEARAAEAREMAYQSGVLAAQMLLEAGSFDAALTQLAATPQELRDWAYGALEHRLNALLAELHVPDLWNAAFLDDEHVLAVDECGEAFTWDAVTGEVTRHGALVPGARPIALADDGSLLLCALDGLLLLADPRGGGEPVAIPFTGGTPALGWRRAAIAPGGRRLAVAAEDQALWLIDLGGEPRVERLAEPATKLNSLRFSEDGHLLAAGATKWLRLYDCDLRDQLWKDHQTSTVFSGLAFAPDRSTLIAGTTNGLRRYGREDGAELELWSRYDIKTQGLGSAFDLAHIQGGGLLAMLFNGGDVRLVDAETRAVRFQFHGGNYKQSSLAVAPGGTALLTCGRIDDHVRLWNARPRPAESFSGESGSIYPLSISPDGALVATGSWDGQARLWEVAGARLLASLPHQGYVDSVAFSPDGRTLACGSVRGGLSLWSARSGTRLRHEPTLPNAVVRWSPDGGLLATGHAQSIRLLDAATLVERLAIATGDKDLTALAFSLDGRQLASGTRLGTLSLWDAVSGARLAQIQGSRGGNEGWEGVRSIAFAPDGQRMAVSWGGSQIIVLALPDLRQLRLLQGHEQEAFAVAWSPDGRRLASGGRDDRLRLWNPDTGGLQLDLMGHEDYVYSLAFTRDGRRILTGSGDHTVGLWDSGTAAARWAERARAGRERERLRPLVEGLFAEHGDADAVAVRIEGLAELTDAERRVAWNLVLERVAPPVAAADAAVGS
jgi:serine/threonine protein kinase/WD40 repeat protein